MECALVGRADAGYGSGPTFYLLCVRHTFLIDVHKTS